MLALICLAAVYLLFPAQPVIAALALLAALWLATKWPVGYSDVFELLIFYGALTGCVVAYTGG